MALQLDAHLLRAEHADEPIDQPADAVSRTVDHRAPGKRHETSHVAVEIVEGQRAFALRRRQLHPRHQPAQIPVALA